MQIALTFDIDMVHYEASRNFDEMEAAFDEIRRLLEELPRIKTTWFIRIDAQMERLYGRADYVFQRHAAKSDWLRANGHEIGWHHHAYRYDGRQWVQETDDVTVGDHLARYGEIALGLGMRTARMGWGYHTNKTMAVLDGIGFLIDSSAMPRPRYRWSTQVCDWSTSPGQPYQPSVDDYRVPAETHLGIWEVPMTTTQVPMPKDTQPDVVRHIELAYDAGIFKNAVESVKGVERLVVVCHPYKMFTLNGKGRPSFCNIASVRDNLKILEESAKDFVTISEVVKEAVPLKDGRCPRRN